MKIKPLKVRLVKYLTKRNLSEKYTKQIKLLEENISYPSLNTEKLKPKDLNLYSFRIDHKYRAIFGMTEAGEIEVLDINDHYQ